MKDLNTEIWMPQFWFFLYSTAHGYPDFPNKIMKRKYYDFVQNIPLFCPNSDIQKRFTRILDTFPVTPYLDNRDSFTYWVHFVQNKLDNELGNEEQTYFQHLDKYYNSFLPKTYKMTEQFGIQKRHITIGILAILAFFILYHTK